MTEYIITISLNHGYIVLPKMVLGFYGEGSPEDFWVTYFTEMYPDAVSVDVEEVENY